MAKQTRKINLSFVFLILSIFVFIMLLMLTMLKSGCDIKPVEFHSKSAKKFEKDLYFMDSNNINGYPYLIVPNIVHYVLFGNHQIEFPHYVSILSVLKNQNPDIIFIHCDCDQLYGHYYQKVIERVKQSKTVFEIRKIEKPKEIFGKAISKEFNNWHSSDITRLRVLTEFGGIFLDNDVYVVRSLDVFRKFEMTINWEIGLNIANQLIIGHRNARFLHRWIDSYHSYDANKFLFNSGEYPTENILNKNPELIHRVNGQFGTNGPEVCPKIFRFYYPNWRQDFYAIDLVMTCDEISRNDWNFGHKKPKHMKFEEIAKNLKNVTFGEMFRDLLSGI